jgi:hypothetical protein
MEETTYPRALLRGERCGKSFGLTAGDTFHQGMRGPPPGGRAHDFGLPIDKRRPDQCESWRAMVARAKADIERFEAEERIRSVAGRIERDAVIQLVEIIRTWANSLRKTI